LVAPRKELLAAVRQLVRLADALDERDLRAHHVLRARTGGAPKRCTYHIRRPRRRGGPRRPAGTYSTARQERLVLLERVDERLHDRLALHGRGAQERKGWL